MPYITKEKRDLYDSVLEGIKGINTKGDLEYCICCLMDIFMHQKQWKYSDLHDCAYAAQHCADEFRRRFLDKREDEARQANGDVFYFDDKF
jgi:hypothetical protein